jgi:hypothetical protein
MITTIETMKVIAKTRDLGTTAERELNFQGLTTVRRGRSVSVYLKTADNSKDIYIIPKELLECHSSHLFLNAVEHGGMNNCGVGEAMIVCGVAGEGLRACAAPMNMQYDAILPCGFSAFFSSRAPIITITSTLAGEKSDILIKRYGITRVRNSKTLAQILSEPLWSGQVAVSNLKWQCQICKVVLGYKPIENHNSPPDGGICSGQVQAIVELPIPMNRFTFAAGAALEKSLCPNCGCTHYASTHNEEDD